MGSRWWVGVVAGAAIFALAACNDGAVAGQSTGVSAEAGSESAGSGSEDSLAPESDPDTATDPFEAEAEAGGDSALPADPMNGPQPFDVDACAVLVRAAGADVIEAALGDPVIDSGSLFASCSMDTDAYKFNDVGSTSTGRLLFGISPTSLAENVSADAVEVDGLAESALDQTSILWHRGAYWFTLQILPVQKTATDPDFPAADVLINIARLVDANA